MRNGASDVLYNYSGEGLDFNQLMEFFVQQITEELQPFPDTTGDELDEDMKQVNADLAKGARKIQEAHDIALEIYDRCETSAEAAKEMQAYEGNEWVPLIGQAVEENDYSRLAL